MHLRGWWRVRAAMRGLVVLVPRGTRKPSAIRALAIWPVSYWVTRRKISLKSRCCRSCHAYGRSADAPSLRVRKADATPLQHELLPCNQPFVVHENDGKRSVSSRLLGYGNLYGVAALSAICANCDLRFGKVAYSENLP